MTRQRFQPFDPDQSLLLPPDLRDWLPSDHLALFLLDMVGELDLSEIESSYDGSRGGRPPYDPRMMVGLLLFGYCVGVACCG